jgi:hypothetical protein
VRCNSDNAGRCSAELIGNIIAHNGDWGVRNREGPFEAWTASAPQLINNLIYDNASGGAIFFISDRPFLLNNTIVYNHGPGVARVEWQYGYQEGWPTIINSIVWGNTNYNLYWVPEGYVSYSDIGGLFFVGQNHNLNVEPAFADTAHDDYRLLPSSPVIDAGNSTQPGIPAVDLDGQPRIQNGRVDIGAYEALPMLISSIEAHPSFAIANQAITCSLLITNTSFLSLHVTITDAFSSNVMPSGPLTWTVSLTPNATWQQTVVAFVNAGNQLPVTNTLQATTEEGRSTDARLSIEVPVSRTYMPVIWR